MAVTAAGDINGILTAARTLNDTITGIAQQAGIDPTDLADFNNIADWNSIRVGDILYIPGSDWQTPLPLPSF